MQYAVTIRAESDALFFGLFYGLFVSRVCRELVDLLHIGPQNVMEVNDRRVRCPAMDARLSTLKLDPELAVFGLITSGRRHMLFAVPLIPRVCASALIFGVLIRH